MFGNPLKAKFNSELLNKPITDVFKTDKIQCKDHTNLEHIEFRNEEIYCKTCGTKLRLIPSWLVPET